MVGLAEATEQTAEMLGEPPVEGDADSQSRVSQRSTCQHFVARGEKENHSVLIAARMDTCIHLQLLGWDLNSDHAYKGDRKQKVATTRTLVCEVCFKQNICHLGTRVVVAGVHGNNRTMKIQWPEVYKTFGIDLRSESNNSAFSSWLVTSAWL